MSDFGLMTGRRVIPFYYNLYIINLPVTGDMIFNRDIQPIITIQYAV